MQVPCPGRGGEKESEATLSTVSKRYSTRVTKNPGAGTQHDHRGMNHGVGQPTEIGGGPEWQEEEHRAERVDVREGFPGEVGGRAVRSQTWM